MARHSRTKSSVGIAPSLSLEALAGFKSEDSAVPVVGASPRLPVTLPIVRSLLVVPASPPRRCSESPFPMALRPLSPAQLRSPLTNRSPRPASLDLSAGSPTIRRPSAMCRTSLLQPSSLLSPSMSGNRSLTPPHEHLSSHGDRRPSSRGLQPIAQLCSPGPAPQSQQLQVSRSPTRCRRSIY